VGGWAVAKGGTGGNGQAPLEREPDPPGLSTYRIRQLADEYTEQAYANAQENDGDTLTAALDDWLRERLAGEVLPEFVEVEFERIMTEVFRI
jgi:cobalamin biosynthesis protein CobT